MPAEVALARPLARAPARLQRWRRATQAGFFVLFLLAPALDLLRFDLNQTQLWLLGQPWSLGIDALRAGQASATEVAWGIVLRGILPALLLGGGFLWLASRLGRVYCGWLCPHFSVVEGLNGLLHRASGRFSLWQRRPTPGARPQRRWWPVFGVAAVLLAALWAITLLSYLLPPAQVWGGLLNGSLGPGPLRFIAIGTAVFSADFLWARHLFCRYGCAVGLFQSLVWMANPRALVMGFDRDRAATCRGCSTPTSPQGDACETACPMRLRPRQEKRWMFSCVQCGRCAQACEDSHQPRGTPPPLTWTVGLPALRETLRRQAVAQRQARGGPPPQGRP